MARFTGGQFQHISVVFTAGLCMTILATGTCQPKSYSETVNQVLGGGHTSHVDLDKKLEDTLEQIEGIKWKDVVAAGASYLEKSAEIAVGVTPQCSNDTALLVEGLIDKDKWALQFLDSFGKPGSGLMQYQLHWLGSYDECIGTDVAVEEVLADNTTMVTQPFRSQYCLASHPVAPQLFVQLGTCFPDTCSNRDVMMILNGVLTEISPNLTVSSVICQKRELPIDSAASVVIVVLSVFALLLLAGTVFDIVYIQMPKWKAEKLEVPVSSNSKYGSDLMGRSDDSLSPGEQAPLLSELLNRQVEEAYSPGVGGKMLLAFSVYTNGSKLLSTKQSSDSLRAVHGIRFISMSWVILGHTYFFGLTTFRNVVTELPNLVSRWTFDAIDNATFSVDTFFLLSGLLVAYLALKELQKGEGRINWFMFYFHRYWRLTPPYMLFMMVYVVLFKYWGSGPYFPQTTPDHVCKSNFWVNMLYLQNIIRADNQCMGWAWYLANDMQFYILSPLIFVPLYFSRVLGAAAAGVFLLATFITTGVVASYYSLPASISDILGGNPGAVNFSTKYYFKPWCRMGPYIIGLVAGYILYTTKCRIRMNRVLCLLGWASAAAICLAVLYGLDGANHGHKLSHGANALYNTVGRTAWAVGVAWVIVACATGNGGFVNTLLSWEAFIPLSRLTYCAYLVHPVIMELYYSSQRQLFYVTDLNMAYAFLGNMGVSYGIAAILSLTFESPMMGLEKALFHKNKSN
ncbi:nose resistant to fluoxetine protein 6-like [Haliotis cracherodii]|uniref:nose resistant to fluoxetine protein 6-like n=1 Tax=Haliotis cracherodii TaxID=6455 RepID=UPI0039E93868